MKVIRYHVEATDNAKFLAVLEKSSHAIYLEVRHVHTYNCFYHNKTKKWKPVLLLKYIIRKTVPWFQGTFLA